MARLEKLFSNVWGNVRGDFDAQCSDDHASCHAWATLGECEKNADFMQANCALSCELCSPALPAAQVDYKRSFDYNQIVQREQAGLWSVSNKKFFFSLNLISFVYRCVRVLLPLLSLSIMSRIYEEITQHQALASFLAFKPFLLFIYLFIYYFFQKKKQIRSPSS